MICGGSTNKTELNNGTTWATRPNMANSRGSPGGSGIQNNGLISGGLDPGNTAIEEFTAMAVETVTKH